MGNSAMHSCVQCHVQVPGQCSVQVLQTNGKVLQFAHPVLAIQVMKEHPGHLVVVLNATLSTSTARASNATAWLARQAGYNHTGNGIMRMLYSHKKVAILRDDEQLLPGNTYYLLPIKAGQQDWARKCLFKSPKVSKKVASSFEYEDKSDAPRKESTLHKFRRSRSLPRFGEILQQPTEQDEQELNQSEHSFPRRSGHRSLRSLFMEGTGQSCEMSLHQTLDILETRRFFRPRRRRIRRLSQVLWKPILESIPEVVDESPDDDDDSAEAHSFASSHCQELLTASNTPLNCPGTISVS